MRSPATPGWGPPAGVVCGCLPLLGVVLVAVPRHSWLGSASHGGGRFCGVWWGVSRGVCVCGAARARVVSVLVCVLCVSGGGVGRGVSSVCVGVCVCVCACVAGAGWDLPLVWVLMWLVCVVVGPSPLLAEVPEWDSPPLLAEFRCRWWWVLLTTPG